MTIPALAAPLARALDARGYAELTPVQSAVLAEGLGARDLLVSARTGSGKTVAYGLAMGETLLDGAERLGEAGRPVALVVAPTRELAMQVERELRWLYAEAGGRVMACVGGMDPRAERRRLELGAHIVVGTPGRLKDHIERGALDLSGLKAAVLDEADEMLDLGFREDLEFILEAAAPERRTLLFSATLPPDIADIARRFQRDAERIAIESDGRGHADIEHRAVRVHVREIGHVVVNLLRQADSEAAIVFCSTREGVRRLHATLAERGFDAVLLSGELSQNERNRALQALRDSRARVCVATDVAARGIDLPNLGLVIHAELPHDAETFQHRSGRTGRAGRKGVSVMLVPPSRRRKAETMMVDAGVVPAWGGPPTAEEIRALDQERMLASPMLTDPASDEDMVLAQALAEKLSPAQMAVALARLHRAQMPAPEEVSDPGERPTRKPVGGDRFERGERSDRFERGERPERAPAAPRESFGAGVWFRLAIGRKQNADPKWLLPMLCRRGGVERGDIGAIRIFDTETKVEIAAEAAERFAATALRAEKGDVTISYGDAPAPRGPKPQGEAKYEPKPWKKAAPKPYGDARPFEGKRDGKPARPKAPFAGPRKDRAERPANAPRKPQRPRRFAEG
ncbi:DEAD/DEAH box helicase [Methylopila jiangsuensis]|uniref:DEAD/DEAH box helicase n=1 Tax=Methylopila jiangsuensis TaxID=586230 RepID=A0A9W6JGJ3_9HYPH|nr:DEAD/DEAH box helicase [Methylopila jiangsuensis]MDR6286456.1 ATP-dependent RNA helicase DeaD [Methylopila jiangsuensis]GLK77206.1 DEAD/DEAH box helicase [Methylopila jiangsuensis]